MTCEDMIYSNEYSDLVINLYEGSNANADVFEGGCVNTILNQLAIFHQTRGREYLTNLERIPYVSIPKLFGLMDSTNMEAIGVKQVQNPEYLGLNGSGVIVGIVDTGIDYTNMLFRNLDGTSRIGVIWDQSIAGNKQEVRLDMEQIPQTIYGTAFSKEQIDQALASDTPYEFVSTRDENGHGSFMAGIAAGGNDLERDFTGIATDAELAIVKLKEAKPYLREYFQIRMDLPSYSETDIIYAIDYLLRYARMKQKPLSLFLGVGSSNGGHKGLTYLERYLNVVLQNVGFMVSVPAGNEGVARLHYRGMIAPGETVENVELNVEEGQRGIVMELWGDAPTTFAIGIVSPRGERIEQIAPRFGKEESLTLPLSGTTVYVAYQIAEAYSGDELIFVRLINPTPGIWNFMVYADEGRQRTYDIWMPLRQFLQPDTYFLRADPENTITNPGNTQLVMTMTAYNHINGGVYAEASRGYNGFNQVKPELAAPGVNIAGPGLRGNYVTKSGTSVAAAHSTGMLAQFLQWDLERYREGMFFSGQIQSFFRKSAVREIDLQYPNPIWGYGIMNIERVFEDFQVTNYPL